MSTLQRNRSLSEDDSGQANSSPPLTRPMNDLALPNTFDRQWSGMSTSSVQSALSNATNSSTRRVKKKSTLWVEKYNNTVAVIGPINNHDEFRRLLSLIKEKVGDTKSHYFRDEQLCGFVYCHDSHSADRCKDTFDGFMFDNTRLRACSPLGYFENEDDIFPENNPNSAAKKPLPTPALIQYTSSEPTPTLVIKNLSFGLNQNKFLEFMSHRKYAPVSVSYHYDASGLFRGVAFAKYTSIEQAGEALEELNGAVIGGRPIKVEFKRRGGEGHSGGNMLSNSPPSAVRRPSAPAAIPLDAMAAARSARSLEVHSVPSIMLTKESPQPTRLKIAPKIDDSDAEDFESPPSPRREVSTEDFAGTSSDAATGNSPPLSPTVLEPSSAIILKPSMEFSTQRTEMPSKEPVKRPPPPPVRLFSDASAVPILRHGMEFSAV